MIIKKRIARELVGDRNATKAIGKSLGKKKKKMDGVSSVLAVWLEI